MNDDDYGMTIRHRDIFESLAKGRPSKDWPRLWEQAERAARAGAMAPRAAFDPDATYHSLCENQRTRPKVDPTILERMKQ